MQLHPGQHHGECPHPHSKRWQQPAAGWPTGKEHGKKRPAHPRGSQYKYQFILFPEQRWREAARAAAPQYTVTRASASPLPSQLPPSTAPACPGSPSTQLSHCHSLQRGPAPICPNPAFFFLISCSHRAPIAFTHSGQRPLPNSTTTATRMAGTAPHTPAQGPGTKHIEHSVIRAPLPSWQTSPWSQPPQRAHQHTANSPVPAARDTQTQPSLHPAVPSGVGISSLRRPGAAAGQCQPFLCPRAPTAPDSAAFST